MLLNTIDSCLPGFLLWLRCNSSSGSKISSFAERLERRHNLIYNWLCSCCLRTEEILKRLV